MTIATAAEQSNWEKAKDSLIIAIPSTIGSILWFILIVWCRVRHVNRTWSDVDDAPPPSNKLRELLCYDLGVVTSATAGQFVLFVGRLYDGLEATGLVDRDTDPQVEVVAAAIAANIRRKPKTYVFDLIGRPPCLSKKYRFNPAAVTPKKVQRIITDVTETLRDRQLIHDPVTGTR